MRNRCSIREGVRLIRDRIRPVRTEGALSARKRIGRRKGGDGSEAARRFRVLSASPYCGVPGALPGLFPNHKAPELSGAQPVLQWGRGHVTAESSLAAAGLMVPDTLQWGRGHVTAESRSFPASTGRQLALQWGRGHVTAESAPAIRRPHRLRLLQWGRGHVTAESRRLVCR